MTKRYEINMCEGPLFSKLILFALPLMLSSILQLLYNAADVVVVGQCAGETALAAVSSTGALINLITTLFIGLSVGVNVATARFFGAKNHRGIYETVHTAMLISIIGGVVVGLIGFIFCRTFLVWMSSPKNVIDQATLYMRIYFLGMPASMIYNFGSSILRAVGDTRRPLIYLAVSGIVNVVLNLILVIIFRRGVAGVAIGTIAAQFLSAIFVVNCLIREKNAPFAFRPKKMHIYRDKLFIILRSGIPAGIQGSVFSLSNVLIQSSINSFGSAVMAGNGAAASIEGFIYVAMNSIHHAALSFTGQNLGAGNIKRIKRIFVYCLLLVIAIGLLLGTLALVFGRSLLSIYESDPNIISYGMIRLRIICMTYFLCGIMDVLAGLMRGLGYSFVPMTMALLGACGLRVAWIYTFFRMTPTLECLYSSYPVSWIVTSAANIISYFVALHLVQKRISKSSNSESSGGVYS